MWWHTVMHGRGNEGETGEWSGYTVPFTLPRNMVYPALLPLMRTPRLPVVDWTEAPSGRFKLESSVSPKDEILVFARVPSHFKRSLLPTTVTVNLLYPTTTEFSKTFLVPATVAAGWTASEITFRVPSLFPSSGKWNIRLFAHGPRYTDASPRIFRKILKFLTNWLVGTSINIDSHTCSSVLKFCGHL